METNLRNIGKVSNERFTGTIGKWFDDRGFGFVQNNGKEYFVHITKMMDKKAPKVGDKVSFKIINTMKGVQATEVEVEA